MYDVDGKRNYDHQKEYEANRNPGSFPLIKIDVSRCIRGYIYHAVRAGNWFVLFYSSGLIISWGLFVEQCRLSE